jgi:hypothetical protein
LDNSGFFEVGVFFLAGVFGWSGVTKLRRPMLAAMAMVDFGVVKRVQRWYGSLLGVSEVVLAAVLLAAAGSHHAGLQIALWAAAFLLGFFTLIVGRSLVRGENFPCACFGENDTELSRATLVRTGTLTGAAVILGLASPLQHTTHSTATLGLAAVTAIAALGILALAEQSRFLVQSAR